MAKARKKEALHEQALHRPNHDIFVDEYLKHGNATEAAKAAGFSLRTSYSQGHRLLKNAEIQKSIEAKRSRLANRYEISRERIVAELAKMAFANMGDYIDAEGRVVLADLDRDKLSAISEITTETYHDGRGEDAETVKRVKLKLADKHRSLELLGRQFGLSNTAVTVTLKDDRPDLALASDEDLEILEAASHVMARLTGPVVEGVATPVADDADEDAE